MGSGDSVQTLTAEVNQLRRTNEALREEIHAKDAEIARLKR
jgi:outer membrane murein-binding lipoprotein Lpp